MPDHSAMPAQMMASRQAWTCNLSPRRLRKPCCLQRPTLDGEDVRDNMLAGDPIASLTARCASMFEPVLIVKEPACAVASFDAENKTARRFSPSGLCEA